MEVILVYFYCLYIRVREKNKKEWFFSTLYASLYEVIKVCYDRNYRE